MKKPNLYVKRYCALNVHFPVNIMLCCNIEPQISLDMQL